MNLPDVPQQALALDEELVARLALEIVQSLVGVEEVVGVGVIVGVGEVEVVLIFDVVDRDLFIDVVHQVFVVVFEVVADAGCVVRPDPFVAFMDLLDVSIQNLLE